MSEVQMSRLNNVLKPYLWGILAKSGSKHDLKYVFIFISSSSISYETFLL